jgi:RimJ/RimL family protein N-acetyltransferase/2-polyprenyl-3-methyl-5-hydroxy-6-metoxy-1,4-benzoquinol methylase
VVERAEHWEHIYRTKGPDQVSWFQAEARLSRQLIERAVPDRAAAIIDIGAGASTLVDGLLASDYQNLTVLDLSPAALTQAQERIGAAAARVQWRVADVLTAALSPGSFDLWHDRAVFHFLVEPADRARYLVQVRATVRPGGHVLVATFAEDGPLRCSGLPVVRYSPAGLQAEFGAGFWLVESHREVHRTPAGTEQAFTICLSRVESGALGPASAPFDPQPRLVGDLLELRPLRPDDFDSLFRVASDPLIWEQHPERTRYQEATFQTFFAEALSSGGALVAVDRGSGEVIGSSRYHGYDGERRVVEIGWSFLARACWGGRYNGEMKRLMLDHAFRSVDRVLFVIGPDNRRSQRAVEKIGGVRAGVTTDAHGRERVVYELTGARHAQAHSGGVILPPPYRPSASSGA